VAPGQLYNRLLRDETAQLPESVNTGLSQFRHGRGNFQLHYAIDGPVRWKTEGLDDVALIHLAESIDSVSKSSNEAERGMLPVTPTICVGQPHRLDPSRCPEGKSILWLQIPDAPRTVKGDAAGEIATERPVDRGNPGSLCRPHRGILASHIDRFADRASSPARPIRRWIWKP
jgi:phytoene dehydrogenase-like protein